MDKGQTCRHAKPLFPEGKELSSTWTMHQGRASMKLAIFVDTGWSLGQIYREVAQAVGADL